MGNINETNGKNENLNQIKFIVCWKNFFECYWNSWKCNFNSLTLVIFNFKRLAKVFFRERYKNRHRPTFLIMFRIFSNFWKLFSNIAYFSIVLKYSFHICKIWTNVFFRFFCFLRFSKIVFFWLEIVLRLKPKVFFCFFLLFSFCFLNIFAFGRFPTPYFFIKF